MEGHEFFNISGRRAMVSLGPLSSKRFCTYSCAHCYVHAGFTKYPKLPIMDILNYLQNRRDEYDIVYVSGDTDSFSKPRTEQGIALLNALVDLRCDILFTTRALLNKEQISRIGKIAMRLQAINKLMFGCVSISRLRSAPHLEPKPIPSPEQRASILKLMNCHEIVTILAVRPFLPVVPPEEYGEIVAMCSGFVDGVLGESWYYDHNGILEDKVLGMGNRLAGDIVQERMDFDGNGILWNMYRGSDAESYVSKICKELNIPFFMRSRPAIEYFRALSG